MVIEYHMPLPAQFWDGYHHMQLCQHSFGMVIIICSSASTVLRWLSSYASLPAQFWDGYHHMQLCQHSFEMVIIICSSASTVLRWFSSYAALPAQFWDGYHHMQLCQHSFGMVIIICSSASTVLEWLSSYAALRAQFWNFKKRVSNYNAALPAQFWDGFQNLQFFILRLLKAEKIKKKFKVYSILYINSFSGISFRFIIHSWLPTKDNFINLKLF